MLFNIKFLLKHYARDTRGLALIESALLLPIMLALLFGLFDLGQALVISQKITSASHIASDLITRKSVITSADLDNAVGGARLVIDPYNRNLFGIDIVGIQFDDADSPFVIWRRTENMPQDASLPNEADGLGFEGEGVVAVTTTYTYTPFFSGSFAGDFNMGETSFMRGRRTSVVKLEED